MPSPAVPLRRPRLVTGLGIVQVIGAATGLLFLCLMVLESWMDGGVGGIGLAGGERWGMLQLLSAIPIALLFLGGHLWAGYRLLFPSAVSRLLAVAIPVASALVEGLMQVIAGFPADYLAVALLPAAIWSALLGWYLYFAAGPSAYFRPFERQ